MDHLCWVLLIQTTSKAIAYTHHILKHTIKFREIDNADLKLKLKGNYEVTATKITPNLGVMNSCEKNT